MKSLTALLKETQATLFPSAEELRYTEIRYIADMHTHLRDPEYLGGWKNFLRVVEHTTRHCHTILVMPNRPKVDTAAKVLTYKRKIQRALKAIGREHIVHVVMTMWIGATTTPDAVREACQKGIMHFKLYPDGVTTGSESGGASDFSALMKVIGVIAECGGTLLIHGEKPSTFSLDAENKFVPIAQKIWRRFPDMKCVMAHVTDRRMLRAVLAAHDNVRCTITPQHALFDLDIVLRQGARIKPDHACYPVNKTPRDVQQIQTAILSGNPKVMFGSDTAPHPRSLKHCPDCCPGVYMPLLRIPFMYALFAGNGASGFNDFMGDRACDFYGLNPIKDRIRLSYSAELTLQNSEKELASSDQKDRIIPGLFGTGEYALVHSFSTVVTGIRIDDV